MDPKKPIPPDFLGIDTSYEQLKKVPYFHLGLAAQRIVLLGGPKIASFRKKDISGNIYSSIR